MTALPSLPVPPQRSHGDGLNRSLLDQWRLLLREAVSRHSKVFVFAFRLAYPPGRVADPDSGPLRAFAEPFLGDLRQRQLDPRLLLAQERHLPGQPGGYLAIALLDGHRTQSAAGHLALADSLWRRVLGLPEAQGLVVPCPYCAGQNGAKLRKDFPDWEARFAECEEWGRRLVEGVAATDGGALQ